MTPPALLLAKLALRAAERGDAEGAAEGLRALVATLAEPARSPAPSSSAPVAVDVPAFAKLVGYTTKHVRALADAGKLATIGAGRGRRILVAESLDRLRSTARSIEAEAREDIRARRRRLRVVPGGAV